MPQVTQHSHDLREPRTLALVWIGRLKRRADKGTDKQCASFYSPTGRGLLGPWVFPLVK